MRFIPAKSVEQQDIHSPHRVRGRLVSSRTQLASQMRGLPQGVPEDYRLNLCFKFTWGFTFFLNPERRPMRRRFALQTCFQAVVKLLVWVAISETSAEVVPPSRSQESKADAPLKKNRVSRRASN